MKKIIAVLMSVLMLVGIFAMYPVSAEETIGEIEPDYTWYDPQKTEFIITNEAQLLGLGYISSVVPGTNFADKTIKLGDNIVLNSGNAADWEANPPANVMTPLGTFCGTFDGNGYSISGIYVDGSSGTKGLLFGQMSSNACVKNLAILNSFLKVGSMTGGIAGRITSGIDVKFENVYVDALLKGSAWEVGGFVGTDHSGNAKVTFSNCVFAGEIALNEGCKYVAGFFANATLSAAGIVEFNNCLNLGKISGNARVAGFVGWGAKVKLDKCVNLGTIIGEESGKLNAGLVGEGFQTGDGGTDITNSYIATDVMTNALCDTANNGNKAIGNNMADKTCEYTEVTTDAVKGAAAATVMDKLDWTNTWTTQDNELPTLKFVPTLLAKAAEGAIDENASSGDNSNDNGPTNNDTTNNDTGDTETETKATETTTPATEADTTEAAEEKGGCGASVAIGSVAVVCLGATAFLAKKKKED